MMAKRDSENPLKSPFTPIGLGSYQLRAQSRRKMMKDKREQERLNIAMTVEVFVEEAKIEMKCDDEIRSREEKYNRLIKSREDDVRAFEDKWNKVCLLSRTAFELLTNGESYDHICDEIETIIGYRSKRTGIERLNDIIDNSFHHLGMSRNLLFLNKH